MSQVRITELRRSSSKFDGLLVRANVKVVNNVTWTKRQRLVRVAIFWNNRIIFGFLKFYSLHDGTNVSSHLVCPWSSFKLFSFVKKGDKVSLNRQNLRRINKTTLEITNDKITNETDTANTEVKKRNVMTLCMIPQNKNNKTKTKSNFI